MSILKKIKDKLLYVIEDSLINLIEEDLSTVLELRKNGVQHAVDQLLESKKFKDVSFLSYAIMLQSDNPVIKEKIQIKNFEIYNECFRIPNVVTFQNVIQKYFEPENIQDLPVINSINDVDYTIIKIDDESQGITDFEVLHVTSKLYRNPYTNAAVELKSTNPQSTANTKRDNINRLLNSIVNISLNEQPELMYAKEKTYSGLSSHFTLNEINKFEVEFTLFHELAHSAVTINTKEGRIDESVSDLCGTLKVIKNNNMTLDQAIDYINYRISFRAQESVLRHHSNKYDETDIENEKDIRIHATQLSLLTLKDFVQKDYEFLQSLNTNEELIAASQLARFSTNENTLNKIKKIEFCGKTHFEEISIDTWTKDEQFVNFFETLAKERKTTKEELIENLKTNITGNTDKIFDVMTAYYLMTSPELLKSLETYTIAAAEVTRNFLHHERQSAINLNLNANFSDKDLKDVIDKQKKSPSKLFSE